MNTCPNEYWSQKLFLLRIKKDSVKLIKYKIFYFDIFKRNTFELIISQYLFHWETIEFKKLGDSPFFLTQNRMNLFFFHHRWWSMISFGIWNPFPLKLCWIFSLSAMSPWHTWAFCQAPDLCSPLCAPKLTTSLGQMLPGTKSSGDQL